MASLRARQKAKRHSLIFHAATGLFSEVGYEQASIEAIAERAEVSIGTIYNYYKNKGDILLSIVATEGERMVEIGSEIIGDSHGDPKETLQRLIDAYVEHPLEFMSRDSWRQALSLSILQPKSQFGEQYAETERLLGNLLAEYFVTLASRGKVKGTKNPAALGHILFSTISVMFEAFIITDEMTMDELKSNLRVQTDVILDLV